MATRPQPDIGPRQVRWAEAHDWYRDHHKLNGTTALYKVVVRDDSSTMGIRYFENFQELRNWAGY